MVRPTCPNSYREAPLVVRPTCPNSYREVPLVVRPTCPNSYREVPLVVRPMSYRDGPDPNREVPLVLLVSLIERFYCHSLALRCLELIS